MYRFACTRVAANSRAALLDDEGTEPTEFDTVTPRQTCNNRLQDDVDDVLDGRTVDAESGDVGGYQDAVLALAQARPRFEIGRGLADRTGPVGVMP